MLHHLRVEVTVVAPGQIDNIRNKAVGSAFLRLFKVKHLGIYKWLLLLLTLRMSFN